MNVNNRYNLARRDVTKTIENAGFIPTGQTGLPQQLCLLPTVADGAPLVLPPGPVRYTELRIYPATSLNSSAAGNNSAVLRTGRSLDHQPDALFPTYEDPTTSIVVGGLPVIYRCREGICMDFRDIYILGTEGDGVFYLYF